MTKVKAFPVEGGCTCRTVRYSIVSKPLFVHCCHCTWCQRESGAAFALNAMIESDRVKILKGAVQVGEVPSNSGKGQKIARCRSCLIALWSHYSGAGEKVSFVRVGTLDRPDVCPPDIHIFTASKQDWVMIPSGMPMMREYYSAVKYWPKSSLVRKEKLMSV